MKLPTMVIIFNKDMADKLSCGIKCAFSAHASMNLCSDIKAISKNVINDFGESIINMQTNEYNRMLSCFYNWDCSDYRKLVMTCNKKVEELFELFKKTEVPVYMQKTSHNIKKVIGQHNIESNNNKACCEAGNGISIQEYNIIKSGTPICVSVFLWRNTHKELLKGMELM